MRTTAGLVALASLAAVGCDGINRHNNELMASLPLEAKEYAGITISLPKGDVVKQTVSYRSGEVALAKKKGLVVVASFGWQVGEPLFGDELVMVTDAIVKDMKRGDQWETTLGERTVYGVYYRGPKMSAVFGSFACGDRSIFLAVMAKGKQAELRTLHDRIVLSAKCVDDEQAGRKQLAPAFVPPPGFGFSAADSTPEGVMFIGLDGSAFLFFQGGAGDFLDDKKRFAEAFENLLAALIPGLELSKKFENAVAADNSKRPVWTVRVPAEDGPPGVGWFVAWRCKSVSTNFTGMYLSDYSDTLAVGKRALLSAGCPGVDDDPVAGYPTMEAVFKAACDAGDERGCATE